MSIDTSSEAESKKEIETAIVQLIAGVRSRDGMRKAREDMNRMRAETQQRIGVVEMAVDLIRDARK